MTLNCVLSGVALAYGRASDFLHLQRNSAGLFLNLLLKFSARFFHLALELLDLNQVLRVERQRRVIAIRFVRAEATVGRVFATRLHRIRQPDPLKVPIVIAQVSDRRKVLARRQSAFIVNDCAGSARIASQLRLLGLLRLRDQAVRVDIDRGLEEAGVAAVVILNRRVTRIVVNHLRQFGIARQIDIEFDRIG